MRVDPHTLVMGGSALAFRGLFRLFGGLEVRGHEHVPKTGPALLAYNHISLADGPAFIAAVDRPVRFLSKGSLFDIPLLGPVLRIHGAFPTTEGDLNPNALLWAQEHLRQGGFVCTAPEGGISLTGRLGRFRNGVAFLAQSSGAPIIPAAFVATERVLPPGARFPRYVPGGVRVRFGPAIHPGDPVPSAPFRDSLEVLTQRLRDAVAALLPPEYVG
jgi:1-acyl-sn-glycerol-3-phosphate acyltransferase